MGYLHWEGDFHLIFPFPNARLKVQVWGVLAPQFSPLPPTPLPMALGVNTFAAHYSFSSSKNNGLLINAKGSPLHRYVYGISLQQIMRTFRLRPSNRIFLSWNMSTCLHVLFSLPVSTWCCGTAYMAALYIMGMQKCTLIYLYFPTRQCAFGTKSQCPIFRGCATFSAAWKLLGFGMEVGTIAGLRTVHS